MGKYYVRLRSESINHRFNNKKFSIKELVVGVMFQNIYRIQNEDERDDDFVFIFDNYKCGYCIFLSKNLKRVAITENGKIIEFKVIEISTKPIKGKSKYKSKFYYYKYLKRIINNYQNDLDDFINKTRKQFNERKNINEQNNYNYE